MYYYTIQMPSKLAERIDGMGRRIADLFPSTHGGFLTNKWFLYLVLFSAVVDLFYFYGKGDMYALTIFFIVGFLASFFSKNMVVILILAIVLTHLIKYGKNLSEGFQDKDEEAFEDDKEEAFEEDKDEAFEEDKEEGFEDKEDEAFEEDKDEAFEEDKDKDEAFKEDKDKEDEAFEEKEDKDSGAKALAKNQKKLMESMKSLEPMLAKAEGFLQTVASSKKDGFATLENAYKLLTPK